MFCGWRLITSKPRLVHLGSGTLEVDAISGKCFFQGEYIEQLTIAEEIRVWMHKELTASNIPVTDLRGARLSVKLSFSVVPWTDTRETFYSDGEPVRTEKMNRCLMECDSNVSTDEALYRSQLREVEKWPIGWPAAPHPDVEE